MNHTISPINLLAATPAVGNNNANANGGNKSWYEAMADAWGKTLDAQANQIANLSGNIGAGQNSPSDITRLTAESLKMSFMAQSSQTSISSVGSALDTMARKQ